MFWCHHSNGTKMGILTILSGSNEPIARAGGPAGQMWAHTGRCGGPGI